MRLIIQSIERFLPQCEQEARDKEAMLAFLARNPDALSRKNATGHMSASAWTISPDRRHVLMIYHNLFNAWAWTGGHADGDGDLRAVALRELHEETGVKSARLLSDDIFSLEILTVDGHEKRGQYVSSHLHLNVTYLVEASPDDPLTAKPDENSGARWFTQEGAIEACREEWMIARVYKKLNARVSRMCK